MEQGICNKKLFIDYPWYVPTKKFSYTPSGFGSNIEATREQVEDSPKMVLRKGDIVKYSAGYRVPKDQHWKTWFIREKDRMKYFPRKETVPSFASFNYAMVVNRYRIVRPKWQTYRDYGRTLMMITGPKILRVFHIWNTNPFDIVVSKFPHKKNNKYSFQCKKPFKNIDGNTFFDTFNVSSLLEECHTLYGDGEEARNVFLVNFYERLKEIIHDTREII